MDFVPKRCCQFMGWRRLRWRLRQGQWGANRWSIASSEKFLNRKARRYRHASRMKIALRLFLRGNPYRGMKSAWWTMRGWEWRRGPRGFCGFAGLRRPRDITKIKLRRMRCCRWGLAMGMENSRG